MKILPTTKWGWARALSAFALAGALLCAYVIPAAWPAKYEPQEGDILFQSLPHGELVDAIEGITRSPWSHCAVVVRGGSGWMVIESLGNVHREPLFSWIQRGRDGGNFAAYRFKPEYRDSIPKFVAALHAFLGRPYDARYRMDDETIYCSELVWKAWKNATGEELGRLQRLGDLNWQPYESTIRKCEQGPVPLDREIITPRGLSGAKPLRKVFEGRIEDSSGISGGHP